MVCHTAGSKLGRQFVTFETRQSYPDLVLRLDRRPEKTEQFRGAEEQEKIGKADKEMAVGTRLYVQGYGEGVCLDFVSKKIGSRKAGYTIRFDDIQGGKRCQPCLKLRDFEWHVISAAEGGDDQPSAPNTVGADERAEASTSTSRLRGSMRRSERKLPTLELTPTTVFRLEKSQKWGFGFSVNEAGTIMCTQPHSPAARAGLPVGATITAVNGSVVRCEREIVQQLQRGGASRQEVAEISCRDVASAVDLSTIERLGESAPPPLQLGARQSVALAPAKPLAGQMALPIPEPEPEPEPFYRADFLSSVFLSSGSSLQPTASEPLVWTSDAHATAVHRPIFMDTLRHSVSATQLTTSSSLQHSRPAVLTAEGDRERKVRAMFVSLDRRKLHSLDYTNMKDWAKITRRSLTALDFAEMCPPGQTGIDVDAFISVYSKLPPEVVDRDFKAMRLSLGT